MLFEPFWKVNASSYATIHDSNDLFVHLLYKSDSDDTDIHMSLYDLLDGNEAMCLVQTADNGIFLLSITRCTTVSTTTNTRDDAFVKLRDFIQSKRSKQSQICSVYNTTPHAQEKTPAPHHRGPILAILARYNQDLLDSLGLPPSQRDDIAQQCRLATTTSRPKPKRYLAYIILPIIFTSLLLLLLALSTIPSAQPTHPWTAYSTHNSIGPSTQLALTAQNASSWSHSHNSTQNYVLRIDDQALVPIELMTAEEKKYQDWYMARYPEIKQIMGEEMYLNESWLASAAVNEVPVDDLFHFSHCVLALKRFFLARQTGHHVCGRDIAEEHIRHCVESLEWWAFPDGKKGSMRGNGERPLWWRGKACFD